MSEPWSRQVNHTAKPWSRRVDHTVRPWSRRVNRMSGPWFGRVHIWTMVQPDGSHNNLVGDEIYYSSKFISNRSFSTRQEAYKWAKTVAKENRFDLCVTSVRTNPVSLLKVVYIGCDGTGGYRCRMKDPAKPLRKNTASKKCLCTFRLKIKEECDGVVVVQPITGRHNHRLIVYRDGHTSQTALDDEQKEYVLDQARAQVKPGKIRLGLHVHSPNKPQPVGKKFTIAYALVETETTEGYTWVLEKLRSLLSDDVVPNAIVTDREQGLIAAIPIVFLNTYHLFRTFHIYNAVEIRAREAVGDDDQVNAITYGRWAKVVDAGTEQQMLRAWDDLQVRWSRRAPGLIIYIAETWMVHRENFCRCYTNKVTHFGNTATSRVEAAYAVLKDWLSI
ncbi:hypothetical protein RND81_12G216900 [Saponaria officinalis]|uniref:MULE transposase domain-containing protein n=1 Tax=Saponaria officinalis TaxID=3572 RepID=A0AAW1HDR5_SAPOF